MQMVRGARGANRVARRPGATSYSYTTDRILLPFAPNNASASFNMAALVVNH